MVASMADRASQRPKSDTSQGLFQTHAATSLSAVLVARCGGWFGPVEAAVKPQRGAGP
jgi:hypothetical protein